MLPRWTAYPALAVVGTLIFTAIPSPTKTTSHPGAALVARGEVLGTEHPRVVILGIDGLDPEILNEVIDRYPDRMQNFKKLRDEANGSGVRPLGTSCPPQSPVAWSNFITGRNPGGHGIFDFIHRDRVHYGPAPSTMTAATSFTLPLPGQWEMGIPTGGGETNRTGKAFWTILGEHGIPADVWRMPINFPVEGGEGVSIPGMMTPAVDSAYGQYSFYSTNPPTGRLSDKLISLSLNLDGYYQVSLLGPDNAFKEVNEKTHARPRDLASLNVHVDEENGTVAFDLEGQVLVLEPGDWSAFIPVSFSPLPMGLADVSGVVRFYLRSIEPELEFYVSPINVDPYSPIAPVSDPEEFSATIADEIGIYYTQGMPEDVNSLKHKVLTDAEFMQQATLVYKERGKMLDLALRHYMAREEGGLLFFYYSSVDLSSHMMWRHRDPEHPSYDAAIAAEDSSWWSGREGSTWGADVVADLYMRMDPILGRVRAAIGEDTTLMVISDHGFAPYRRKFSLNTWLMEKGYMVLKEEEAGEDESSGEPSALTIMENVDWSQTKAFGMGFNGLYLNLKGREDQGIVTAIEKDGLLLELKRKLEALIDDDPRPQFKGQHVVLNADLATEVYEGERMEEAPDILVGYNVGYGNSDEASQGEITEHILTDNLGGTFNGSHLMDPRVVKGTLLSNRQVVNPNPRLEDLTVQILSEYGIEPHAQMVGKPVFK